MTRRGYGAAVQWPTRAGTVALAGALIALLTRRGNGGAGAHDGI